MDSIAENGIMGLVNIVLISFLSIAVVFIIWAFLFLTKAGRDLRNTLNEALFANWRLSLLGATGLVLSLASGWTTWDGMRNFTQEPILSLMITFGIQGVMLIVAWLIGESFATGMNYRPSEATKSKSLPFISSRFMRPIIGTILGMLIFGALALLVINQIDTSEDVSTSQSSTVSGSYLLPTSLLIAVVAILLLIVFIMNSGRDIARNYLQAVRVIIHSAVLWVMFLACMATSVFFSFDSLFSTIFPKEERVRAAELRAQNQVAGVLTDIGKLAYRRRLEEQDRLFLTENWQSYDAVLERLTDVAKQAPKVLQAYFEDNMREHQRNVAQRQLEKSAAESQQTKLKQSIKVLNEKISRARSAVAQLSPVVEDFKNQVFTKDRELIAKKAEAQAEAGGIGVTGTSGRGPKYRAIMVQVRTFQEQKKNLQLQLDEYEKRLKEARDDIAQSESELSTAQGELATLKGRANTASQLIQLAEKSTKSSGPSIDATSSLQQLERARIAFRQKPQEADLTRIQDLCNDLISTMAQIPDLKTKTSQIDCDPGQVNESASRVFALNAGIAALISTCIGGDKLPKSSSADELFLFARQCIQNSGLPSRDTDELRTRINYLELNRDDKAHRFVVTTNAFTDGNKLAHLALTIAIAIDSLVFMSGLFGANAMRSPLSDIPSYKGRSAKQLEAIIDTALQPHPYETARLVLGSLRPITAVDGFTGEIIVEDADPHATDLRRVLNAGSSIGAVRHTDHLDRVYQVRAEFFEYLSIAAQREFEKDKNRIHVAELERTVSVALLPDVGTNAEIVLDYMNPIHEDRGFMAEVMVSDINNPAHLKVVKNALNAGAVYERVQRVQGSSSHYYIHSDFYKTLSTLRARLMMSSSPLQGRQQEAEQLSVEKEVVKDLDFAQTQLPKHAINQLTDETYASQSSIEETVRAYLITTLGIDRQIYEDASEKIGSALDVAAKDTIKRLINTTDESIGKELEGHLDSAAQKIDEAAREMKKRLGSEDYMEAVDEAENEFQELLPILAFSVNGIYHLIIRENIHQLEQAAGEFGPEISDHKLLDRLRRHNNNLVKADSVDDVLSAIAVYLNEQNSSSGQQEDLPNVVVQMGGNTRKI